jgi:hypothetical protein
MPNSGWLAAAHLYQLVVLWFEHDSYDQLILARCLAHFADASRPARLELICIDRHPSVERFIGLGQLDPPALASLWPLRTPVTQAQLELGRAVWTALRRPIRRTSRRSPRPERRRCRSLPPRCAGTSRNCPAPRTGCR